MSLLLYSEFSSLLLIPIRKRRYDKCQQRMQGADIGGIIAEILGLSTACYADQKPIFRILCGSI